MVMGNSQEKHDYWVVNIRLVSILLGIWFVVGYGFSIFFIDALNQFHIGQLGLGFWMAQQGSIFVFVALVLIYALLMDRVDRSHGLD